MIKAFMDDGKQIPLAFDKIVSNKDLYPCCNKILDLVNVFTSIFIADIRTAAHKRNNILVRIPVCKTNLDAWHRNTSLITKLLNFVTEGDEDKWSIEFYPINYSFHNLQQKFIYDNNFSNVSLLSGGLDSFCGISTNSQIEDNTIYCGYKTSNLDAFHIDSVFNFAKDKYSNIELAIFSKVNISKVFMHQRTRSLLFFSLACLVASNNNIPVINVYENGIMTLNPSFQSRGTTKTTHPKTIKLYQNLINDIGINIKIQHPYLFLTKGEIVNALDFTFRNKIKDTRSCSRSRRDIRFSKKGITSCGACVPCLLRKISLAAYDMEKFDHDYFIPYKGDLNNTEYLSAYNYFYEFSLAIKQGRILSEIDIRQKYYNDPKYLEKTFDLLNRFNTELEIFFNKYGR